MRDGDEFVYVYSAWVLYVIVRWVEIDNDTFAFECSEELMRICQLFDGSSSRSFYGVLA